MGFDPEGMRQYEACARQHRFGGSPGPPNNEMLTHLLTESLILAQNERWQRGLGMQVERDPGG